MDTLEGKVAFITGGAGSIGLALATLLVRRGARVVLADRREEALRKAALHLGSEQVRTLQLEVTDRAAVEATAADVGTVGLLVNCAGICRFDQVEETEPAHWDRILGVNLSGVFNTIHAFVPRLKAEGRGGHILNVSSMAAFVPGARAGAYAASKAALCALSESLWYSLAPEGIGVSVLCPGLVRSQIHRHSGVDEPALDEVFERGMDPLEVAERALAGVLSRDLYIFTHPEHKEEVEERFKALLKAFPREPVDPGRLEFEASRRAHNAELAERGRRALEVGRE